LKVLFLDLYIYIWCGFDVPPPHKRVGDQWMDVEEARELSGEGGRETLYIRIKNILAATSQDRNHDNWCESFHFVTCLRRYFILGFHLAFSSVIKMFFLEPAYLKKVVWLDMNIVKVISVYLIASVLFFIYLLYFKNNKYWYWQDFNHLSKNNVEILNFFKVFWRNLTVGSNFFFFFYIP
jgi:hypothetical protein